MAVIVEFTVTEEDVVAFHLDHARPEHRPASSMQRVVLALLAAAIVTASIGSTIGMMALPCGILAGVVVYSLLPQMLGLATEQGVRRLHAGQPNPTVLGAHRLTLGSDGIDVESSASRFSFKWST